MAEVERDAVSNSKERLCLFTRENGGRRLVGGGSMERNNGCPSSLARVKGGMNNTEGLASGGGTEEGKPSPAHRVTHTRGHTGETENKQKRTMQGNSLVKFAHQFGIILRSLTCFFMRLAGGLPFSGLLPVG